MSDILNRDQPVDFRETPYPELFRRLQGNIVKGHGRDFTVSIFVEFQVEREALRRTLRWLTRKYVRSAYDQLVEREQFARFHVPGSLFGNLFLTRGTYEKLDLAGQLPLWFRESTGDSDVPSPFVNRMLAASAELHDTLRPEEEREPLEVAYARRTIDAQLLLADDSRSFVLRQARALMTHLESKGLARIVAVELGEALRSDDEEGIEHFGFVDGRSQPLFLTSDFRGLQGGTTLGAGTTEKVNDKTVARESGKIDVWNPFAPLSLALLKDPGVEHPYAFGSYYVFRKLEQDVRRFAMAEQQLADVLALEGRDRDRAGAMIVGRFRDGTPLALSATDGFIPAKANNFRYDGLGASHTPVSGLPADPLGLKCPFQSHIRKVNPRQNVNVENFCPDDFKKRADDDRSHRIVRRGITYGRRKRPPHALQPLEDLPSDGVGLLFACFQSRISHQFAFMQRQWANNGNFMVLGLNENQTGLDSVIGQGLDGNILPQHWRTEYGGTFEHEGLVPHLMASRSHPTKFEMNGSVKFRGGEFFFAPSLTFLRGE